MEPAYFAENRYSFVINALPKVTQNYYEVESPETSFEYHVQSELAKANSLLMNQKYGAALEKYLYVKGLITTILFPKIPILTAVNLDLSTIGIHRLTDELVVKSIDLLKNTPVPEPHIPKSFRVLIKTSIDPELVKFENGGFTDADADSNISPLIDEAIGLVDKNDFNGALKAFTKAHRSTQDPSLKSALLHDIAIVQERLGEKQIAFESMNNSIGGFGEIKDFEYQVKAMHTLAGMKNRNNDGNGAAETIKSANELKSKFNLFPVLTGLPKSKNDGAIRELKLQNSLLSNTLPMDAAGGNVPLMGLSQKALANGDSGAVELLSYTKFSNRKTQKQLGILTQDGSIWSIGLGNEAVANITEFYKKLQETKDPGILMGYLDHYTVTVAYLTHIYSWVLPMALGDCYAALGSFQEAERVYLSTLQYKYLNGFLETVNLWLRLAELYEEWGNRIYRNAGKDIQAFQKAKEKYELIITTDNALAGNSPLYHHAAFASMKTRVNAIIQAMIINNGTSSENPRIIQVLLQARLQLTKIANNLNFLGISVATPPFSFEYMQTVARYFCQHAGQVEQMYIQFMSTAENEKLREQQMSQQATLATASVELERRGLTEAREGLDVATASFNYADVQLQNANTALNSFNNVRWELLELDTLQAWANASAVDRDDQVKLTISGYSYYSADSKRRNVVLQELAAQRTRISHELEEARLQREIAEAQAYKQVSQQQIEQARARVNIAAQRIVIAQTQERFARENLEFLQGREFSSAMWYNLARQARRFAGKYLDMAIEVSLMMEIAYEAETGRDLRKIKMEYGLDHLNGLMGAEALMLDIDYFTLDYLRTRARKAQMKQSISLADNFPMAFSRLLETGNTYFETTMDFFDRRYPGYYLQKVKQVEVVMIGLNGTEGVHGTLRNIGVSKFRKKDGSKVNQLFTADVMPLSEYNVRNDAIVFQLDTKELRLFENNGIATMWQLDLPLSTNTFPLTQILDIQLVVYYDGFFDAQLEQSILAALPASDTASRGLSMQLYAPDELFFLKNQGSASISIEPALFPANQKNQILTNYFLKVSGEAATIGNMKVRLQVEGLNQSFTFTLDADGNADSDGFQALLNRTLLDKWNFTIDPADNPHLVQNGKLNLYGLRDLSIFLEYKYDYR